MSQYEIEWMLAKLRNAEDKEELDAIIDEYSMILTDNKLFERVVSPLWKERRQGEKDLQLLLETQGSQEDIDFYQQELSNIDIIISTLNERLSKEKEKEEIQKQYPFLRGDSKFVVLFSGLSPKDIERIPKNKMFTILGCIQNELATEILLSNIKPIEHTNQKYKTRLNSLGIHLERKRIGDYRIAFYRKGGSLVIIGITKKTGNDIDYNRYDNPAEKISEIEEEREQLLNGTLPKDSPHFKTIENIYDIILGIEKVPTELPEKETLVPEEQVTEQESQEETSRKGTNRSEWHYMYITLKAIYDKYASIGEEVLQKFPEIDFVKWIVEQKRLFQEGKLKLDRKDLLEKLGIQFDNNLELERGEESKEIISEVEESNQPTEEVPIIALKNPILELSPEEIQSLDDEFIIEYQKVINLYQRLGTIDITTLVRMHDIETEEVKQILKKWRRPGLRAKFRYSPLQIKVIDELLERISPKTEEIEGNNEILDSKLIDRVLDLVEKYYQIYGMIDIPPHYKMEGFELGEYLEKLRALLSVPGAISPEQLQRVRKINSYPLKPSTEEYTSPTSEIETIEDVISDINHEINNMKTAESTVVPQENTDIISENKSEVEELFESEEKRITEKKEQIKEMLEEMSEEDIDNLLELLNNSFNK